MLLAALLAWLEPLCSGVLYIAVKARVSKENILMAIAYMSVLMTGWTAGSQYEKCM